LEIKFHLLEMKKLITSPDGTSPMNKVVPELEVVVNSKTPAPPASDAIIIPLNLTGAATNCSCVWSCC
jgi:hypothetical protein